MESAAFQADGVSYFSLAECGKEFFRCTRLKATLSVPACEKQWRKARGAQPDELGSIVACQGCELGATHAGEEHVYYNPLYGSDLCPRCRRGVYRLIGNRICVICYNREREFKIGKNGKGTPVTFHFDTRRVGIAVDYDKPTIRYFEIQEDYTKDDLELVIQIMRVTRGRVAFVKRLLGRPAISTLELATIMGAKRPKPPQGAAVSGRRAAARETR